MSYLRTVESRRRLSAGAALGLVVLMVLGATRGLAQDEESPAVVVSTATRCLNVREGPDLSTRALRCVPPETRMALLESGPDWGRVRLADGTEGWVALRLVSPQDEAPAEAAGAEDRQTDLRRLGELEARTRRLEEELVAQQAASSLLQQSVEDSRELFAARLTESDRLLATSAALRQRLEEEKAGLETRVAELESALSAARATAQSNAAARAEAEAASALREQDLAEKLEAASARRRNVEQENAELAARVAELELTSAAREESLAAALEDERERRLRLEEENEDLASGVAEVESAAAASEQELQAALTAAEDQRRGIEQENEELAARVAELESAMTAREREKADLEARLFALESAHAEAVAQLESRLRAAEGFLAASEAERRGLAERLAAGERAAPEPGTGASAAGAVKPLRVSIPPQGAAPTAAPPDSGQAGEGSEEALRVELLAIVESWAAAWSERRVDDYLSFYSSDFEPPSGTGRAQWEEDRRARVGRSEEIEVTVALMDIRIDGARRAEVDLILSYESGGDSDTVLKTLTLGRERDRWRIVREEVAEE